MLFLCPFSGRRHKYVRYTLSGVITRRWNGISGQKTFGSEFEVIIQRGAKYKVTKIERKAGMTYIDLEIHPEKGYNLYQQDVAEWKGSRKNFKGQTVSIEDEKKGV